MSGLRDPAARFRPDIEGLRGVAVLLVVFGHLTGWPPGGFVGVDIFFVVSGFLITGLLVAEQERVGRIDVRQFYLRRARRLLPAGVLVLAVTDVVAALLLLPSRAHQTVVDSLWSLGFLANVHFAAVGTHYFSLTRTASAVEHYWSLSVEEQFYLLWPCLILASLAIARRFRIGGRPLLTAVAAVVVGLSLVWSVLSTAQAPVAAYFSSPARAWELGAGALLALLATRAAPAAFAWLGAGGLVASVFVITTATAVPGYALVLPVLSTVAVLAAGGGRLGLATPPLRYVGKISYSLYLWHWPCIILGATVPGGRSALGRAALLVLAGLLSVASYSLVEQPLRYPSRRAARARPGVGRLAAPSYALVLLVAISATWYVTDQAAVRPPAGRGPMAADAKPPDLTAEIRAGLEQATWPQGLDAELVDAGAPEWVHDKCLDVSEANADRCTYGPAGASRSVALVGDSVAVSWLPALRRTASLADARIHVLTLRQCANLRGFVSPACATHQDWELAQVRRLRPELVVLSARYQGHQTPDQWREGTARMLADITPYTRHIVVLAPPPDSGNLLSCYTRLSTPRDCNAVVSSHWRAYAAAERSALAGLAGLADFVDTRPWFCAADRCPAVIGGAPVMWDGRHLAALYAVQLAPVMASLFR